MIKIDVAPPDNAKNILLYASSIVSLPNVVSMVDSRVNMDTQADARLIAFEAEYTGLLYLRYFTVFIIASINDVNVYAANAIVVIS